MRLDCDITSSEIQQPASADALAAFFSKLGHAPVFGEDMGDAE